MVAPRRLPVALDAALADASGGDGQLRDAAARHVELCHGPGRRRRWRTERMEAAPDVHQMVGGVVDRVGQHVGRVERRTRDDSGPRPAGGVDRRRPARQPGGIALQLVDHAVERDIEGRVVGPGLGRIHTGELEPVDGEDGVQQVAQQEGDVAAVGHVFERRPGGGRGPRAHQRRVDPPQQLAPPRPEHLQRAGEILHGPVPRVEATLLARLDPLHLAQGTAAPCVPRPRYAVTVVRLRGRRTATSTADGT